MRPNVGAWFVLAVLWSSATAVAQYGDVAPRAIVVDGRAEATIWLPGKPEARLVEAATELQQYIAKASGAILPIAAGGNRPAGHVIRVEVRAPEPEESAEAFSLTVGPGESRILGNSPLAALYGAYEFLERVVGVRWYLDDPLGEVVPRNETLIAPTMDVKLSPSFPMRWVGTGQWAVRNKQNRCDDGFLVYPGIYHTQAKLLPHKEYFAEHPEYFALISGKRSDNSECKLCYSNPDVVREIAKNMGKMLDENPGIDLLSLSPTDGQLWCDCESCRAMDEQDVPADQAKSRRSLLFYNAVADELRKTHPQARMLVGAYNVYNWPPKDPDVRADPMLSVIITHYEHYCLAHPVSDPECPRNRRYVELIQAWEKLGCPVYYYEYYWKVNWLDLPWPIVHSIREDMRWYKERGHQGVYTQYNADNLWTLFPNHYVAARLLWDVNTDVDALLDRMYADLFGAAAEPMKRYYAVMENRTANCGQHFPGQGLEFGPHVFTPEVRQELRRLYQEAVKLNADPTVGQRLEKIGRSLEYVDRLMEYASLKAAITTAKDRAGALKAALECGETLVKEIRSDRKKWGGVISQSIVRPGYYLARDMETLQKQAGAAAGPSVPQAKPATQR